MYLGWISIAFYLIYNLAGLNSTIKTEYYYFLNSDIEIDSITSNDLSAIRVISGDFACTKCLEGLGDKFERYGKKEFAMVYETLSLKFSRDDLLSKVISARGELSSKLRTYDGEYKIVFSLRPKINKKKPYIEISCEDNIVIYSYEQLFNENIRVDFCE